MTGKQAYSAHGYGVVSRLHAIRYAMMSRLPATENDRKALRPE